MIPTKIHGLLDYAVAIILIALPWILGTQGKNAQTVVPVTLGVLTIIYSLITRYECSAVQVIPMRAHLFLDVINALILASSPWVYNFASEFSTPYVIGGIFELLVVALSSKEPEFKTRRQFSAKRFSGKEY